MSSFIVTHYTWYLASMTLWVSLVCDYHHRVPVADNGGQHNDQLLHQSVLFPNMIDGWDLLRDREKYIFFQVIELTDSQRMIECLSQMIKFFSKPGKNRLFLASGKSMFCGKIYMLSRFTISTCVLVAVVAANCFFVRETSRSSTLYFSLYCLLSRRELT